MKQFSSILNIILAIAVAILYWLHFSSTKHTNKSNTSANATSSANTTSTNIAYFNVDSINQLPFIKSTEQTMTQRQLSMENEIKKLKMALQNRANNFQKKASEGGYTQEAAEAEQRKMAAENDAIDKKASNFSNQLMKESEVFHKKLNDALQKVLKEINSTAHYDFILSHQEGGALYEPNEQLNITNEVMDGLLKEMN